MKLIIALALATVAAITTTAIEAALFGQASGLFACLFGGGTFVIVRDTLNRQQREH